MKLHSFLAVAAVFAATALHAQSVNVQKLDDEKYTVANGDVTLTVDVAHGAKILSFKRTSPQAEWNWPPVAEYDSLPYSVESADASTLVALGQPSRFGYRVQKAFSADPADGAFIITYSIINESGETRKVAPWAITRVPNGGYLEFDAKAEDVTPLDLMKVSFNENGARLDIDVADQNRKINVDGKGWLKFHDNGLVLTQKFPDIAPADAAPGEAEIQVYIDARKSFVEIEAQGPYTELQPGEKLDWTVRWYLAEE